MQLHFKSTVIQWFGSALSKSMGLVFALLITRGLGATEFGRYTTVITFLAFFSILSSFGLQTIAIREMAKYPEKKRIIMGDTVIICGLFSMVCFFLCIGSAYIFNYEQGIIAGIKIASLSLLFGFMSAQTVVFKVFFKMQHAVAGSFIRDSLLLLMAVYLWKTQGTFILYIWATVFAGVVSNVYVMWQGSKIVLPKFQFNPDSYFRLLKMSLPLGISGIALYIYNYIDTIMLSKMAPIASVGYYGVAYKFVFLLQEIPRAALVTLFPIFSAMSIRDKQRGHAIFQYSFDSLSVLAIVIAIVLLLSGREIVLAAFSKEYVKSVFPLYVFSINFLFMFPNMLFSQYLIAEGRQKMVLYFLSTAALANIAANFYVIPRYAEAGAACTTMMSEMIFLGMSLWFLHKSGMKMPAMEKTGLALLIAGAFLAITYVLQLPYYIELVMAVVGFSSIMIGFKIYRMNALVAMIKGKGFSEGGQYFGA